MASGFTEWYIQLFNTRTRRPIDDDLGVCNVLTENSPVEISIYTSGNGQTAASNPMTFTNGVVNFWTADTVTAVDLSIQLNPSGHSIFAESMVPSNQRIDIDPDRIHQELIIPYTYLGASETIVDTGFDVLATMIVTDIHLDVSTVMTGGVLDIGTSTDSDGFADGVAASVTGFPITLLEEAIVSTSALFGALLAMATGTYVRKKYRQANATSGANIVYTNTTISSTAGNGYIAITYRRVPTR